MLTPLAAATLHIEPTSKLESPSLVRQKPSVSPPAHELGELALSIHYNESEISNTARQSSILRDLESHGPTPPRQATNPVQSLSSPPKNKYRFASSCVISFVMGLNDSAPGALIPYVETYYRISYGIMSLIFVTQAVGFIVAAPFTTRLQAKLGRSKMLLISIICCIIGYVILVSTPAYPAVVAAMLPIGLGQAWLLALNNVFCTSLVNATTLLGVFHGSYGIGGTVGPLIATVLVSNGRRWSTFYYLPLAISCLNVGFAFLSYRGYESEITTPYEGHKNASLHDHAINLENLQPELPSTNPARHSFIRTLVSRATVLGALFIFAYQGAEVGISGWILSFLITNRPHDPSQTSSIGYITAGFWAGITLGRFLLSNPAQRIGERVSVYVMIVGALGFQFMVWFIPNIIGSGVAVAIVGLLLGPLYPCAMAIFSRLLDKDELVNALSVISAMGSSGGAAAPFLIGIVSQRVGTWVLHPIVIGLFGTMIICWTGLPRISKRKD